MRTPGWLGVILVFLIALVAGGIGFAIGTTTTLPADASGVVAAVPVAWHGWGFPFFPILGILCFFLFIAFVMGMARRAAWAGRGWYGPHGWGGPGNGDPRRAMLDDWHRQAHEQPTGATSSDEPATSEAPAAPTVQPPYQQQPYGQPPYQQPQYGQPPYQQPPSGTDPTTRR